MIPDSKNSITTTSSPNITYDQPIRDELGVDFWTNHSNYKRDVKPEALPLKESIMTYLEEFSDKNPDEIFGKLVDDSIGTLIKVCKYIHFALTAVAILQLVFTLIVLKRQRATCIAPIGSRFTRGATWLVACLNVLMIASNCVIIICFWQKNYSLSEYAPLMYSGASYGTLWFLITLFTVLGYGRGICAFINKRFLLYIMYYMMYGTVYGFFAWFINSWLCGFIHWIVGPNMVLFLFVEVVIRTLFVKSGYTCMRKTVKKSEAVPKHGIV
ncbi:uncharacterized protein VICG_01132 [Vittaforma corneae ATCC 50505]|uniref:Uncharacterized protein n=1 Tax=Vittaforma corneae (strain ATCC 50505) TaxID=993615 RepID=L2GMQ2_VITCO|nr:uncharacterized protein VICG_01132 [Vittaforma corneae ATCC 50505]ELA41780.1 hypothetical protein VICG_01132 [Vittaforma corneae ATCC 50505]